MKRFVDLQLLRIITGNKEHVASVYNKKIRSRVSERHFRRLYLFRVVSNPNNNTEHSALVYVMEYRTQNVSFWIDNATNRDNGNVSIGSFVRLMCPKPIESYMRNDIPLIESGYPFILLKTPSRFPTVSINEIIGPNISRPFVSNTVSLSIDMVYPQSTQCSGLLCDRQRVNDWNSTHIGCGCYGMLSNASNVALIHSISAATRTNTNLFMDNFSSLRFQQLYMQTVIPLGIKHYRFRIGGDLMDRLLDAIDECIQFINMNGGLTIVGWYKRGVINDRSMIIQASNNNTFNGQAKQDDDAQVNAGDVNYHIVQIIPTNHDFLDNSTNLGTQLFQKKLNFSTLNDSGSESAESGVEDSNDNSE